jgi:hypothetical protein
LVGLANSSLRLLLPTRRDERHVFAQPPALGRAPSSIRAPRGAQNARPHPSFGPRCSGAAALRQFAHIRHTRIRLPGEPGRDCAGLDFCTPVRCCDAGSQGAFLALSIRRSSPDCSTVELVSVEGVATALIAWFIFLREFRLAHCARDGLPCRWGAHFVLVALACAPAPKTPANSTQDVSPTNELMSRSVMLRRRGTESLKASRFLERFNASVPG